MSRLTSRRGPMSSINITPLTDVLLVLLITFLLTATSFQDSQLELPLPRLASPREISQQMVRVSVDRQGRVQWPDPVSKPEGLEAGFGQLRSSSKLPVLALAVHRDLVYEKLYPILRASQAAGWTRIVLLTEVKSI